MARWHHYLGLPHALAADPEDGHAADCLLLAFRVLDELELPHPAINPQWFDCARAGQWKRLQEQWEATTIACPAQAAPADGDVCLITNRLSSLGVAIVIDGGLLFINHRRGVTWASIQLFPALTFRRFTA